MSESYEIYADEAWVHCNPPLNRYWCFFGGILGRSADLDRLDTSLRDIKSKHGIHSEVKWKKLSSSNIDCYKEMVDSLIMYLANGSIKYRQMFVDRSYVIKRQPTEDSPSEIDTQFKLYYQYIKHSFGLEYLPQNADRTGVLIRLDNHSSQAHKQRLVSFCEALPGYLGRLDLEIRVTFIDSRKSPRLQICDVLMGAAGSHGNNMHKKREAGQRGMTPKQRLRHDMCLFIYNKLKVLDAQTRGSKAFNWFETTGHGGNPQNRLHHSLRIWKFIPKNHVIDRGWPNDHLDKQGHYIAPDLFDPERKAAISGL